MKRFVKIKKGWLANQYAAVYFNGMRSIRFLIRKKKQVSSMGVRMMAKIATLFLVFAVKDEGGKFIYDIYILHKKRIFSSLLSLINVGKLIFKKFIILRSLFVVLLSL